MNSYKAPKRRYDRVADALKKSGPLDVQGIAAATGQTTKQVAKAVQQLRALLSPPLHIRHWTGYGRAVYQWGQGVDAPRPPPMHKPRPNKHQYRKPKLSPRLQIPAAPMPPLAWMTTQPTVQMSAKW